MKKSIFYVVLILLALPIITSAVCAHDGDGGETAGGTVGDAFAISNPTVFIVGAFLLALATTGIVSLLNKEPLTKWQYGIAALGSVSGFIHLGLGLQGDMLLLLNGLGYLALLAALFLPVRFLIGKRQLTLWLFLGYTAITFIGYFLSHPLGGYDTLGLVAKVIETGLIACIIMDIKEKSQKYSVKSMKTDVQIRSEVSSD